MKEVDERVGDNPQSSNTPRKRGRKGWKIALISLGSLLGLVVIVVAVACWLLFTPARLTAIVNKLADDHILCENHFDKVDLSLFKTWPNVGVEVENVVLVNPYQLPADNALAINAVQNDTLARIRSLTVGLDLRAFLKDRSIIVRQLRVDDAHANLYTAPDGWNNLDIFAKSEEKEEEEDTTSSGLPETIQLEKIVVNNLSAQYCNLQQQMLARADNLDLKLKGKKIEKVMDADLSLDVDCLMVDMRDSLGNPNIYAELDNPSINMDGYSDPGVLEENMIEGKLALVVPKGRVTVGDKSFVTDAMLASRHDLLKVKLHYGTDMDFKSFSMMEPSSVSLLDYVIGLDGTVALADETEPMRVDVSYNIDDWKVGELLEVLPTFVTQSLKGMDVDARLGINGTAKGVVAEGQLPLVSTDVTLKKGSFSAPKMLPIPVKDINADVHADLCLSTDEAHKAPSSVEIRSFSAKAKNTNLAIEGTVDDLMEDMLVDARIKGNLNLPDLKAFLPDTMPIALDGTSKVNLKVKSRLSQLTKVNLNKIQANGTLDFAKLDVHYDSIHATSPSLKVAVVLPKTGAKTKAKVHELIGAHITGGQLNVEMAQNGLSAHVVDPDINVGLPNILDKNQSLAAAFDIKFSKVNAEMDSMLVYSDTLKLKGSVRNDKNQDNVLKQWNPDVDIDILRGVLAMNSMSEAVRMTNFEFNYKPEVCNISRADILWGVSDYHLSGKVYGVEDWLDHKAMLRGTLDFGSQYADIDQLLGILSGMGSDEDTLQQQRVEDNVPKEANPFIVPKDVNVRLNTHVTRCVAFGNDLNDLGGSVTVNDGTAVLEQIGFTCKAARMQLTGVYRSPRVNNLFVGLDFHLLDIDIDELLDLIPSIDTLVPMLSAFQGKANFHLAAECNLNAFYKPKMSTLIGAAAINGNDLVVMDNSTVATMAKLLQFKNWREKDNNIGVDSISVEATVFRKEIIVYPFMLNLHNYQLCIGGRHTLENNCNYHLELLKAPLPARLAIDVAGNISKPQISLGKLMYPDLYMPEPSNKLSARTLEIKQMVRKALEANVKK